MNVVKVPIAFFDEEDLETLDELTAAMFEVCDPRNCTECPFYGLIATDCNDFRASLNNIVNTAKRNNNTLHSWGDD